MRSVADQFENYSKLNKKMPAEPAVQLSEIETPSALADAVAANIQLKVSISNRFWLKRIRFAGWKWRLPSWKANWAYCRSKRKSVAA